MMCVIEAYCRRNGVPNWWFVDDAIIVGKSFAECHRNRAFVRATLRKAGWIESLDKGMEPTTVGVFLGLTIHTKLRIVTTPEEKLERIKTGLSTILSSQTIAIRMVARVYGLLVSTLLATGPVLLLLCREGFKWMTNTVDWDDGRPVTASLRIEISFLLANLRRIQGHPFVANERVFPVTICLASDASGQARAVAQVTCTTAYHHHKHDGQCGKKLFALDFSAEESTFSSTWRELRALYDMYVDRGTQFQGQSILHLTDAKSVEQIMLKGSSITSLQSMAIAVYKSCLQNRISLQVQWRPQNDPRLELEDDLSRTFDLDDWGISNADFQALQQRFGVFTVDLFPSDRNRRVDTFFSAIASEFAAGRNAFAAD